MKFFQIDPRPQGVAVNEQFFAENLEVLGIEVTEQQWANRCSLGNIDHHSPGDTAETPSACEQVLEWSNSTILPAMVTVRPDADSITAMAVITNRLNGRPVNETVVREVGLRDRLGPAAGKPSAVVVAIARKAGDFKVTLADRVAWVADLLAGVDKSVEVAALVAATEGELKAARQASEVSIHADGRIAVVVSTNRFATTLGYESAPVVIALNPAMPVDPKDPAKGTVTKFTACRYDSHVKCDLPSALKELQALEPGWGGRGDIFGSPQGASSKLTLEQVVEVVSRHLI